MTIKQPLSHTFLQTFVIVLALCLPGCATQWGSFRQNELRTGSQPDKGPLSDPSKVGGLHIRWTYQPPGAQGFRASPIVYNNRVYIGNGNGYLYALDANTGTLVWQYPAAASPALTSQFTCNASSRGIAATAAIAKINGADA